MNSIVKVMNTSIKFDNSSRVAEPLSSGSEVGFITTTNRCEKNHNSILLHNYNNYASEKSDVRMSDQ